MPNAWFWHTFQLMTFAVPVCFVFFLAFCNGFCIHELAKSASFFCNYVSSFFQVLAHFCAPFFLSPRNGLQVAGRRCYNVSGTSYKLLDEDVTTYQERLASYWTKMLQRIRKSWLTTQATGRYYTPPKRPPPKPPPTPPENHPQKKTIYKSDKSDNSLAPRGAPSAKTCHEE